jgi:ABC-type glycerol-3-phosphate transport system permease component
VTPPAEREPLRLLLDADLSSRTLVRMLGERGHDVVAGLVDGLKQLDEAFGSYPVLRWTQNSFVVAGSVTLCQVVFSMAGYGFAKKRFPLKELLFWVCISSMMVPGFALLIALTR